MNNNRSIGLFFFILFMASSTSIHAESQAKKTKSQEAKIEGEVVDLSCYLSGGMRGEGHKTCAVGCIKKGTPAGLVDNDGNVFVIVAPSPGYAEYAAQTIRLSGKVKDNNISPSKMEIKDGESWSEVTLKGGTPQK